MSSMYYYAMDNRHATSCGIRFELDSPIDYELMSSTIQKRMKRFPYLCQRLVERDGRLYTQYNGAPLVLHNEPLDALINAQQNDGHLIRFSYWGNVLSLQAFHGIGDGTGINNAIKMILFDYYRAKGEEIEAPADLLDMDTICPEETADPFDLIDDDPEIKLRGSKKFHIIKDKWTGSDNTYLFSCDSEQFMKYVKSQNGTPNTVISMILANAIRDIDPSSKKNDIDIGLAVNSKPFLGIPKSHLPGLMCMTTSFNDKLFSEDPQMVNADLRRRIKEFTQIENIQKELAYCISLKRMLSNISGIEGKRLLCKRATEVPRTTATVSYVGKVDYGGVSKHIRSVYAFGDSVCPLLEINCTSDRFYFSFNTKFDGLPYMQAINKSLTENGIECSPVKSLRKVYADSKTYRLHFGLNRPTFQVIKALRKSAV